MTKWSVLMLGVIILFVAQIAPVRGGTGTEPVSGCCKISACPEVGVLIPEALQTKLAPYLASSIRQSKETGVPLVRALSADFPKDEKAALAKDQCMVGPALMVAPITGGASREVYLPVARWFDYWTGEVFGGGKVIRCEAAEGRVPIFVKGSSIVPTAYDDSDKTELCVFTGFSPALCTLCPNGGAGCCVRASRCPNGMKIVMSRGGKCTAKSAVFIVNVPYRRLASVTVDGHALAEVSSDELSGAVQGWNHEGSVVRIKVPFDKEASIRMAYAM